MVPHSHHCGPSEGAGGLPGQTTIPDLLMPPGQKGETWQGSYLKGLNESPQQCPDAFPPAEKLHQAHHSEKTEKGDGDSIALFRVLKGYHGEVKPSGK